GTYGPDCSIECYDTDDCSGHYICSDTGSKDCMDGWGGDNCQERTGEPFECLDYINTTNQDLRGFWDGNVLCDSYLPFKYTLEVNVTSVVDKPEGTFQMKFINDTDLAEYTIRGTYSQVDR
ncbi:unnamed protein product, partial [Owenia fusiformis]